MRQAIGSLGFRQSGNHLLKGCLRSYNSTCSTKGTAMKRFAKLCLAFPMLLLCSQGAQATTAGGPGNPDIEKRVFSGEAVARTDNGHLLLALDEADAKGRTDGRVDHLFYILSVDLVLWPLFFRDPSAEVVLRPENLVVRLHGQGEEVRLRIVDTQEIPEANKPSYTTRKYTEGLEFVHYSGDRVQELTLGDIEQRDGRAVVKYIQGITEGDSATATAIEPLFPSPDPEESSSTTCKQTCSTLCDAGSCRASCVPGRCAKCDCLGENPSSPYCVCY